MTPGSSAPLPSGSALTGWRRDLAAYRPSRTWLGSLLIHRVEALVGVQRRRPLDALAAALLRRLAVAPTANGLHLDAQLLSRLTRELTAAGLLDRADGRWRLTEGGRQALAAGTVGEISEERREFTFVDDGPDRPLRYLRWQAPAVAPVAAEGAPFDVAILNACLGQSPEWKAARGFPDDVVAVSAPDASDWRRIVVDHVERCTVLFVLCTSEPSPMLRGFPLRADGVGAKDPALTLGAAWEEVLPDLALAPPPEAWREAWRAWCQARNLPPAEVDACRVEWIEDRVRVFAPAELAKRLRHTHGEVVKGEAWLLAGSGAVRAAAAVELIESEP
jgi:hypothetical protein